MRFIHRKLADGTSSTEALRALKRQLPDVLYRRLLVDHQAPEGPGSTM